MKTGAELLDSLNSKHLIVLGTLYDRQDRPFSTKSLCRFVLKLRGKDAMEKTRTILNRLERLGLIANETERGQGVQVRDWRITSAGKMLVRSPSTGQTNVADNPPSLEEIELRHKSTKALVKVI